jgi:hypothetical protein
MKHALIATSVAAWVAGFGWASAQGVNEPQKRPAAVQDDKSPAPHTSNAKPAATAPHPETTGRAPSEAAAGDVSEEEAKSAAEARRVRAAVGRTLERTRELSRPASD